MPDSRTDFCLAFNFRYLPWQTVKNRSLEFVVSLWILAPGSPTSSLSLKSPWHLLTLLCCERDIVYLLDFAHLWKSTEIINGLVSINALLGWNSNSTIYGKPLYNGTVENQLSCFLNLEGSGCCWNSSLWNTSPVGFIFTPVNKK